MALTDEEVEQIDEKFKEIINDIEALDKKIVNLRAELKKEAKDVE